jgi:hypothetical protein
MFNAGADGLYLFNPALGEPQWWREIGETKTMAGKDRIYGITSFEGENSFQAVDKLTIEPGSSAEATFQVGEDPIAARTEILDFRIHLWDHVAGDDIDVSLNGGTLGALEPADPGRSPHEGQWLQGRLDPSQVRRGENHLQLVLKKRGESASSALALDAVQLRFRCR